MTLRAVDGGQEPEEHMDDDEFFRQVTVRAELLVARWSLAHWQRRVRELEAQLPESNPLRSAGTPP